jgi:hypothetical protein
VPNLDVLAKFLIREEMKPGVSPTKPVQAKIKIPKWNSTASNGAAKIIYLNEF